jgi:hypothetical protein
MHVLRETDVLWRLEGTGDPRGDMGLDGSAHRRASGACPRTPSGISGSCWRKKVPPDRRDP